MIKILICVLLAFTIQANDVPELNLSSPRSTFKVFLQSMVLVKNDEQTDLAYTRALETLSIEHFDSATRKTSGRQTANQLIDILDRTQKINYEDIPDSVDSPVWIYTPNDKSIDLQIIFVRSDKSQWRFSKQTIDLIPKYYSQLHNKKVVSNVTELKTFVSTVKSYMPKWMSKKFLFLTIGQWVSIELLLILASLIKIFVNFLCIKLIRQKVDVTKASRKQLQKAVEPLGMLAALFVSLKVLPFFEFSDGALAFWTRAIYIALSVVAVWFGIALVGLIVLLMQKMADATTTKVDDILVPLLEKVMKGVVIVAGILLIAYSLKVDVSSLLAGLGIGAMAFAFAAKDTLANFFGSIMIVLDRPFDLGDYISASGMTGTVEEVGFRSTRLRSTQDSIISIPNGQLANANIDNFGRRRFRRSDIVLGLEYDTSPQKIDEFCDELRRIIASKEWAREEGSLVHFDGFGDFSLNINIKFFILTQGFATAATYKHEIMLEFLELGNSMGVGFAFPTQTLHLKK